MGVLGNCWESMTAHPRTPFQVEYPPPGIFSDSNNIFLWHESEDINIKAYFQIFSWFWFYVHKLCMIMCIGIAS